MKIKDITFIGMLTAFICIISPITLPALPVPITLSVCMIVFVSITGGWKGTVSVFIYVLLGALGLPVFSNFTGGFQQIAGVTGGYIIGYIPMSAIIASAVENKKNFKITFLYSMSADILMLIIGALWYGRLTEIYFLKAISICVFPFVIMDILKIAVSVPIAYKVKNRLVKVLK